MNLEGLILSALDLIDGVTAARARAGSLLLGLDFDGTLAPIVPRPEHAALPAHTRPLLDALARRADTHVAFISGRSLHDLSGRIQLERAYYAGNHGLEISGPDVHRVHPEADAGRERMAALARVLELALSAVEGVIVEDKGLTLSVHYRLVDDEASALVRAVTEECARGVDGVHVTHGKKVVELRPAVAWDKGRAFNFLRTTLEQTHGTGPAIFVGDDRTDEDVFRELTSADFGIVVGDPPPGNTAARACLRSTKEVAEFLRRLDGADADART